MTKEPQRYRVLKTLSPGDRGTAGLVQRYGDALVCVRHRTDAKGKVRHTTVELLVESTPIRARTFKTVCVKLHAAEHDLRKVVAAAGGVWEPKTRTWRLPSRVVSILNLRHRVVSL